MGRGKIHIQRKTQIISALLVTCVFLFQNCATILSGTSQKIPVTSNPLGANIIVDGKDAGFTPLELELKKKKNHIIRIEKQGYNPLEIRITREISPFSFVANIFCGILGAIPPAFTALLLGIAGSSEMEEKGENLVILGFILGWGAGILADFKSGAIYDLSHSQLSVTLKKTEGKPQPNFLHLDAEQFQNIKWIRIKCADSDEEEIVNLD